MINKFNNFPVKIELEVLRGDTWEIMVSHVCNNYESLYKKMEVIRSLYAIKEKNYRIYVTYQSKINRLMKR